MPEETHITSSDGRHRVAYEMALNLWNQSKNGPPNLDDRKEFLELVSKCTEALVYGRR